MSTPVFGPGYQMTMVRTFDAPRDLVFDCFTKAEHMAAWWGPHHFTAPVCELDARPGGKINILMSGPPPWENNPMEGEFVEVSPPERLVFTARAHRNANGEWGIDNLNELTFEEADGKTVMRLTTTVRKVSDEILPALGGMELGWSQSFEKLSDRLAAVQKA